MIMPSMLALALEAVPHLAALRTFSDLLPYLGLFALGFLVAAWGQVSRVPLAVVLGITLIIGAVILFQLEANDFSGSNSPF